MKTIAFYTLGCKANQYQTFGLQCQMTNDQCQMVDFNETAEVYVINTCTVTEDADRKSRQAIRRAIRQNPKAKVIVTGCYAKLNKNHLIKSFPKAEIIDIPNHLSTNPPNHLSGRVRVNLMIQDGCEHFCSYCIVPYARGRIKSKPLDQVMQEANCLVEAGAREIVLTGINLGTYGKNVGTTFMVVRNEQTGINPVPTLPDVLRELSKIDNLYRIRLSSLEPMYIDKALIDAVAETPKACHHLHIPLQSGDDQILKSMNRNYSRKEYLELINYVRKKIPDCGITTDIIAGFPGEGEREFQNTVDVINEVRFSRLHIFTYSARKGTPAADFPKQVDEKTRKKRSQILHTLRAKHMLEFAGQYLNREVEILVEQKGEGLTSNYIRCFFDDPADSSGNIKKILAKFVTNSGEIRE